MLQRLVLLVTLAMLMCGCHQVKINGLQEENAKLRYQLDQAKKEISELKKDAKGSSEVLKRTLERNIELSAELQELKKSK